MTDVSNIWAMCGNRRKMQIYQTSGIVLKPNVHKCTSQELFQKVSTKQNAVTQASLALLASEEHGNGASLLAGEARAADVPTLQVSTHTSRLVWSLTQTESILQGSYSLFREATESAQDPMNGALLVLPQLPLQYRGQRTLLQPHLCSEGQSCLKKLQGVH